MRYAVRDYKHPSILELRTALHYPTSVQTGPGHFMQEPPAIEGFLWRVKPVSGALTRLYFTTYDGTSMSVARARFPTRSTSRNSIAGCVGHARAENERCYARQNSQPFDSRNEERIGSSLSKFVVANKSVRRDEDVATLRQNVLEAISILRRRRRIPRSNRSIPVL